MEQKKEIKISFSTAIIGVAIIIIIILSILLYIIYNQKIRAVEDSLNLYDQVSELKETNRNLQEKLDIISNTVNSNNKSNSNSISEDNKTNYIEEFKKTNEIPLILGDATSDTPYCTAYIFYNNGDFVKIADEVYKGTYELLNDKELKLKYHTKGNNSFTSEEEVKYKIHLYSEKIWYVELNNEKYYGDDNLKFDNLIDNMKDRYSTLSFNDAKKIYKYIDLIRFSCDEMQIPEFNNINNADSKFLYYILDLKISNDIYENNEDMREYTTQELCKEINKLFGKELDAQKFLQNVKKENIQTDNNDAWLFYTYMEDQNPGNIKYCYSNIKKQDNKYIIELIEYINDYKSQTEYNNILAKTNGDVILNLPSNTEQTKIQKEVLKNKDKFLTTTITLYEENESVYLKSITKN